MLETKEKRIESLSKEVEDMRKNEIEVFEVKNAIIKISLMDGVISKMEGTEEIINKLENRVIAITQQRENRMKKQTNNQSVRDL